MTPDDFTRLQMAPQAMMAPQKPAARQFIKETNWIPEEFEKNLLNMRL